MNPSNQMAGSLVLSKTQLGVFGFVLAVIAVAQQFVVDASPGVHTVILMTVTTLGALGATSADAALLGKLIPHQVALYLTLAVNVGQAINALSELSSGAHAAIGAALVLLGVLGIHPTSPIKPVPPSQRPRPR